MGIFNKWTFILEFYTFIFVFEMYSFAEEDDGKGINKVKMKNNNAWINKLFQNFERNIFEKEGRIVSLRMLWRKSGCALSVKESPRLYVSIWIS